MNTPSMGSLPNAVLNKDTYSKIAIDFQSEVKKQHRQVRNFLQMEKDRVSTLQRLDEKFKSAEDLEKKRVVDSQKRAKENEKLQKKLLEKQKNKEKKQSTLSELHLRKKIQRIDDQIAKQEEIMSRKVRENAEKEREKSEACKQNRERRLLEEEELRINRIEELNHRFKNGQEIYHTNLA